MQRLADGTLAGMTQDEAIEEAQRLAETHRRAYVAYTSDYDDENGDWRVVSNKSHIAKPSGNSSVWWTVGVNGHAEFSGTPWFRNPPNQDALTPEQVRNRRKALDITQEQLAQYLGLARKTINEWERGHAPVPTWLSLALDRLDQLVAFGKTVRE